MTVWSYAIIQAARRAHQELCEGNLSDRDTRHNLVLLRCGQHTLERLKRAGTQLPEIDLTYPPR